MRILADLHLHSPYSRATTKRLSLAGLEAAARIKGLDLLGTADACHPAWLERLSRELEPAEEGFYRLRPGIGLSSSESAASGTELIANSDGFSRPRGTELPTSCAWSAFDRPRFVLSTELASVYRGDGRGRRVHHLVLLPSFESARRLQARLGRYGKLEADGRPIVHLDSRDLLELVLESDALSLLLPAHIWTPWYSVLGSKSGFDSIEDCYRDLTPHIGAIETGLSSDPPMNWALSSLDPYAIVSNSDAHSPEKLGREGTVFEMEPSYAGLKDALSGAGGGKRGHVAETIEFFPEQGKYHWDGHRACGVTLPPKEASALGNLCPICGKGLTQGVLHRIMKLADRPIEQMDALSSTGTLEEPGASARALSPRFDASTANRRPFKRLLPLRELLSELLKTGPASKKVESSYRRLVAGVGSEIAILAGVPAEEVGSFVSELLDKEALSEALRRMRRGQIIAKPGSDGLYGSIRLFAPGELGK